jgi:pimeloyl-ACP methyl ester carboxylesterase
MSVAHYAEANPKEVLCLAPISTTINYELLVQSHGERYLNDWKTKGHLVETSTSKPGVIKHIGWGLMEDLKKYDLLQGAKQLTMPVLLMVGDKDHGTPYKHQQILFNKILGTKKLVEIKNADHSFRTPSDKETKTQEVTKVISNWLQDIVGVTS